MAKLICSVSCVVVESICNCISNLHLNSCFAAVHWQLQIFQNVTLSTGIAQVIPVMRVIAFDRWIN